MMNLLVGKTLAEREGVTEARALQLGLIAGMMPPMQGLLMAALIARRERPTNTDGGVFDDKTLGSVRPLR